MESKSQFFGGNGSSSGERMSGGTDEVRLDVEPVTVEDGVMIDNRSDEPSVESTVEIETATAVETEATVEATVEAEADDQSGPVRGPSKLLTGRPCGICGAEQAAIRINVDGNTLLMESCDGCDIRRWQLAGERIDLQEALNQVGEHSGRRR